MPEPQRSPNVVCLTCWREGSRSNIIDRERAKAHREVGHILVEEAVL